MKQKRLSFLLSSIALASLLSSNINAQQHVPANSNMPEHIKAQQRKITKPKRDSKVSMPLEGGMIVFECVEKNGMQVPNGPMEFKKGNYTEKGECRDGYRDGKWEAVMATKTDTTATVYNFKKGMLDGPMTRTYTSGGKESTETYNFYNGRLVGESRIVVMADTLYCSFGSEGKRVGNWRVVNPMRTIVIEYNQNPALSVAYQIDSDAKPAPNVIPRPNVGPDSISMPRRPETMENQADPKGRKQSMDLQRAEELANGLLKHFDRTFTQVEFSKTDRRRPKLPALGPNKYGYIETAAEPKAPTKD